MNTSFKALQQQIDVSENPKIEVVRYFGRNRAFQAGVATRSTWQRIGNASTIPAEDVQTSSRETSELEDLSWDNYPAT